jgi:hypothetical protein
MERIARRLLMDYIAGFGGRFKGARKKAAEFIIFP